MIGTRVTSSRAALFGLASALSLAAAILPADAANKVLKIGFVGVTSGPAAAWGTSNVRSMQTLADMVERDRRRQDRRRDLRHRRRHLRRPEGPEARHRRHGEDGARKASTMSSARTSTTARPRCARSPKRTGIIYFPYAFPKALYTKPASNAVLGMVANYQSGPAIYKYLKENKGVKTVAFVAANESDPLSQRDGGVAAAKALGLDVVADKDTYENDTTRLHAGADADRQAQARSSRALGRRARPTRRCSIRSARELGYQGPHLDRDRAGRQGARGGRRRSRQRLHLGRRRLDAGNPLERRWKEFIDRYTKKFGEYNDESNTKVYALEYIIDTLKANPKAIDNVDEFKKTMDTLLGAEPLPQGSERQAELCRHDLVRPEAPARGAAGRQRVQGRQVQDAVRRRRRLKADLPREPSGKADGGSARFAAN